ncbi:UDP-2,3-diacylglucosamine diphosphatase [Luteimonas sp. e5]
MSTFFIADLHLEDARPETSDALLRFLREEARGARALYILGDLFEAWIGDDAPDATAERVAEGLRALADSGTALYFIHGNRDFLLGEAYAARCRMRLLPDPAVIMLDGEPVLIGHGDLYCTDDLAYQEFRAMTRAPQWRAQFLAQPLPARIAFAAQARAASKARHGELREAGTAETITDVNPARIGAEFERFGVRTMIHGHTHRPALHEEGAGRRRIVLGDWHGDAPRWLRMDGTRADLARL